MPAISSNITVSAVTAPSHLPQVAWEALRSSPHNANILVSSLLKARNRERAGEMSSQNEVWIVCCSKDYPNTVDFILSCTEGLMGSYPIFLFTPHPFSRLDKSFLEPRIHRIVQTLHASVPRHRVYSVFAPEPVAKVFARIWSEYSCIPLHPEPFYYAAKLTYCSKASLSKRQMSQHPDLIYEIGPATENDIPEVAPLCWGFASESEPFTLSEERAIEEATLLVQNNQLWVHRVRKMGENHKEIASILAFTREGDSVTGITKVYTSPAWRSRGCAERLVRTVCKFLLKSRSSVVLYVAHNNPAAQKVYRRVGFAGLGQEAAEGVDPWLEIGFHRSVVELGQW